MQVVRPRGTILTMAITSLDSDTCNHAITNKKLVTLTCTQH